MTPKREKLIIFIGTVIGVGAIIGVFNYMFPSNMGPRIEALRKELAEPDPFEDHYDLAMSYFEKEKHDLALNEANKAMEIAKQRRGTMGAVDVGMTHSLLLDIYLAMGDVENAEKELEWREEELTESGTWERQVNETQTLGDKFMVHRRRLEELKKSQQLAPAATAKAEDLGEVR